MTARNRWTKSDQPKHDNQFAINSDNINQALGQYKYMLGSWVELSEETSRFMNCRLKEDLKVADEIIETGNAIDAAQVQARFMNKMFADYSNEAQKILHLMSKNQTNGATTKSKKKPARTSGRSGNKHH